MKLASMLSVSVLLVGLIISCGSNSSDNGTQSVTYSDPTEAANGASSAKASVDMTSAMSEAAAGLSSSSNPSGYAPGKGGAKTTDTSSIANIDPKLKKLVDGMLASMKTPAVRNAVSKARASKAKVSMSPGAFTLTSSCTDSSGTFTITGTDTSVAGTYVEYTVDIRFDSCKDLPDAFGIYSVTTGTIHAYDKEMAGNAANTRNATIDLTAEKYDSLNLNAHVKTDVVKGTFNATDSGTATSRSGRNTANGSFSETDLINNETGTFYFTNMTGDWTWDFASPVETVTNTANGNFGLNFVNASQTLTLNIGLSNLQNKLRTNTDASIDQWVNGSVTITWTPDLSIFGCRSGRITFTTADATPLHYLSNLDTCPDSGTLQVNNATIVYYGPDDPNNIVITVGAVSVVRPDCSSMEGGICGN
ncbi:MAG: hypothetical protein A2X58_09145 [Nitrospirae bacterium GWC2_56_14]|nr:MAG: hypothetical protein A2X58_09145 [Nitrospirae bacterium GWC2_56_14]